MKYLFSDLDLPHDKIPESKIMLPPCKCGSSRVSVSPDEITDWAQWICTKCANPRGWVDNPDDRPDITDWDEDELFSIPALQEEAESSIQPRHKLPENKIMLPPCDCGETKVAALKSYSYTSHWGKWLCLNCADFRGWIEPEDLDGGEA